jgi:hypothetical protein
MLRASLVLVFLCLAASGAQAQLAGGVASVSRFPIDTQASAQNQRDLNTAMGRAFSAINGYMANLLVQDQIETRILDVAVNASIALRRTGAKGYLVEVNVYQQASGVPAFGNDFLVESGPGDNPDAAYLEAALHPSFRPAPYTVTIVRR